MILYILGKDKYGKEKRMLLSKQISTHPSSSLMVN